MSYLFIISLFFYIKSCLSFCRALTPPSTSSSSSACLINRLLDGEDCTNAGENRASPTWEEDFKIWESKQHNARSTECPVVEPTEGKHSILFVQ